jgi:hypothetical protein
MGLSPFQTPYQLWLLKTRRAEQKVTPAMQRGTELEPAARAAYEAHTGQIMEPLVLVDGEYSASLDGITLAGDVILENRKVSGAVAAIFALIVVIPAWRRRAPQSSLRCSSRAPCTTHWSRAESREGGVEANTSSSVDMYQYSIEIKHT